jgi:hypothetical protein
MSHSSFDENFVPLTKSTSGQPHFFWPAGEFARALQFKTEESDGIQLARESKATQIEDLEPAISTAPAATAEVSAPAPAAPVALAPAPAAVAPVAAAAFAQAAVVPAVVPQFNAALRQPYFNQFFSTPYFGFPRQQLIYRF